MDRVLGLQLGREGDGVIHSDKGAGWADGSGFLLLHWDVGPRSPAAAIGATGYVVSPAPAKSAAAAGGAGRYHG